MSGRVKRIARPDEGEPVGEEQIALVDAVGPDTGALRGALDDGPNSLRCGSRQPEPLREPDLHTGTGPHACDPQQHHADPGVDAGPHRQHDSAQNGRSEEDEMQQEEQRHVPETLSGRDRRFFTRAGEAIAQVAVQRPDQRREKAHQRH